MVYSALAETCLDRRPTPQEFGRLSYMDVAPKRVRLFIELGLSIPEIENMEDDARKLTVVTQITRMFLRWTYSYPNHTYRHIEKAMKEVDMATDSLGTAVETGWECVTLDDMEFNQELHKPLDVSAVSDLVDNMGKDYFNLFLELGLSVTAIEMCEMDHREAKLMVKALIKLCIDTFRVQATFIRILKAMKMCKMNWYTTAMSFCVAGDAKTQRSGRRSVII